VLGGGLPTDAINMLIGLPGTGKTILAQQYVFANASPERPALYLATVSEPFEKILRYGQTLRFFDPEAVGRSVFYEDLGTALNERGLVGVLEQVSALIKERRPGMIVIDSFKALSAYADAVEFRRFLHDFAGHLSAFPASSFWLGEYGEDEIAAAPEFAVADAIISLATTRAAEREWRSLRVLKLRGSEFAPGKHAYRLSADGIDVFPRLADEADITGYSLDGARHSSGIAALDEMLPLVYQELRRIAVNRLRHELPNHTLQPTALVNEAYLRLIDQKNVNWQNRAQFFGLAAEMMRRILVNHANSFEQRDVNLVALDEALKNLATIDPRQCKIVEMKFFGGLTVAEIADVLQVSSDTIERDWKMARAWLHLEISNR